MNRWKVACMGLLLLAPVTFAKPAGDDVKDDDRYADDGEDGAGESVLADSDTNEPEGVDCSDDEGEAVGSGDGGKPREQRVIDLSDAENVPGKTGDPGSGEFDRYPGERNEQQSS